MNCSEFKNSISEYLRGGLSDVQKSEFKEHLLSCEYCKKEVGEQVIKYIEEEQPNPKREVGQKYTLYFILFILFAFLVVVSIQYLKLKEYQPKDMRPISQEDRLRLMAATNLNKSKNQEKIEEDIHKSYVQPDLNKGVASGEGVEDFSRYSKSELLSRFKECKEKRDYRCISQASMQLAKISTNRERREFRLMAIEALVEMNSCAVAMLNIMMLLKEGPDKKEIDRSHLLNAKCYIKEKNYSDAKKILDMVERDAVDLKDEIQSLRLEIEKGERDGG